MRNIVIKIMLILLGRLDSLKVLSERVASAVILGISSDKTAEHFTLHFYSNTPLYSARDFVDRGLFTWEKMVIDRFFPQRGAVLVLGAGGGREVKALLQRGFRVYASESIKGYVDFLKNEFGDTNSLLGVDHTPASAFPEVDGHFNAIIFGWGMYTSILSKRKRIELLKRAVDLLDDNGVILVSYWIAPEVRDSRAQYFQKLSTFLACITAGRVPEEGDKIRFFSRGALFGHYFSEQEIEEEFSVAGLVPVFRGIEGYTVLSKKDGDSVNRNVVHC